MRVLIAGCGDVGSLLGERLAARGHQAFGLRRSPGALPSAIVPVAADLADRAGLGRALAACPAGFDQVVYSATPGESTEEAYRRTYIDGQRNLLEVLATRPRRVVFVSSTSVYGQSGGEWVDEDSPTEPSRFSGRCLVEAEQVAASLGLGHVAVRFGGIYGPGRTWLVERVRGGSACAESLFTNRIHREDCAGVLDHLLALERPAAVYVGVDSAPAAQCEVMDWLAGRLGVARPERAGEPAGATAARGKRCRNDRLLASGYRLRYPDYRAGYGEMLG